MKTRKLLWTLLPVVAVLLMTACGGDGADDVTPAPTPVTPTTDNVVKSQPYTVTVNTGDITRTSVDDDDVTLRFESSDKLYVQNADGSIYGCLELESGAGETSATFTGTIHYTGAEPAASTQLTATLVGSGNLLNMIGTDGKVKGDAYISIPATICETVSEAVQKYSWIRGTGTYGTATFRLAQRTAFLRFSVTLEDGTAGNASVTVIINNGSDTYTGSTVTTGSQFNALASFVLPMETGKEIAGDASICVANVGSDDESITFGTGSTVTLRGGKVYPITRTKDFVRLWAGGPLWASRNLGASSVTGYGNYYAWGETTGYPRSGGHNFYWESYKWGSSEGSLTKYNSTDRLTTLEAADDAATQALGSSWHIQTEADFTTGLTSNTTNTWSGANGVPGRVFTGKDSYAGKAIFLPAPGYFEGTELKNHQDTDGYYLSSMTSTTYTSRIRYLYFNSTEVRMDYQGVRCYGFSIRPIRN